MNIAFFSCIYFELTSIKQTTLNKWGSKWLVHVFFRSFIYLHFYMSLFIFTFIYISTQSRFIFPFEYK